MKEFLQNLKSLASIAFMFGSLALLAWTFRFVYLEGEREGMRKVAKHIPEIRRITRLDALAPRNK